jgi:hypothetical protein
MQDQESRTGENRWHEYFEKHPAILRPDGLDEPNPSGLPMQRFGIAPTESTVLALAHNHLLRHYNHSVAQIVGSSWDWQSDDSRLAWAVLAIYASDAAPQHTAVANAVLDAAEFKGNDEERRQQAGALAADLAHWARKLQTNLGWNTVGLAQAKWAGEKDKSDLDPALDVVADLMAELGDNEAADTYRTHESPWSAWVRPEGPAGLADGPTRSPVIYSLGFIVYERKLRPKLEQERERARHSRAALVRQIVVDEVLPVMRGEYQPDIPGLESPTLKDSRGRIVARIDGNAAIVALATKGLEAMGSPVGHRVIGAIASAAWEQQEAGAQNAGVVEFQAGWEGLARAVRHDPKDTATLRAILEAGQSVRWLSRSGQVEGGGFWTWSASRGGRGTTGLIRVTVGDPLRPSYALSLERADRQHTASSRAARTLIPLLRNDPPARFLSPRSQGAAWLLSKLLLVEMVDGAEAIFTDGGIDLDDAAWRRLAGQAHFPLERLSDLRTAWIEGDSKADKDGYTAPPLIKYTNKRVTLSDAHELERIFIEEGGRRRSEGRRAGKIGAKGRASKAKR